MFPEAVPSTAPATIKEPPPIIVNPSDSLIVKFLTEAPVVAPIIGAVDTSGIVTFFELVGNDPVDQLLAVPQSTLVPIQVVVFHFPIKGAIAAAFCAWPELCFEQSLALDPSL